MQISNAIFFKYVFSLVKFILYDLKHCLPIVLSHNLILSSCISHTFLLNQYVISHRFGCWKIFYIMLFVNTYSIVFGLYIAWCFFFFCDVGIMLSTIIMCYALFYKLIYLVLKKKIQPLKFKFILKKEMWIMNIFLTKECE